MNISVLKNKGRRYWRNLVMAALLYIFVGLSLLAYGVLPFLRAGFVAQPNRSPICCTTPIDMGLEYEEISFATDVGLTLHGWYIPSQNGAAVIVTHGFGGNRVGNLEQAVALAQHGYGILIFDLLAHGESEGETLAVNGDDVVAAARFLEEDVGLSRIGIMGFSLGGLVAIQGAAQTQLIKAVLADAPLPVMTIEDMASPRSLKDFLWVPFDLVQLQALKIKGVYARISVIEALSLIEPRPVFLIAGAQNRFEQRVVQDYYAAAGDNAEWWEIPDAGHLGGWIARPAEYEERMVNFFDQALLGNE